MAGLVSDAGDTDSAMADVETLNAETAMAAILAARQMFFEMRTRL